MKKILFITNKLSGGGSERVLTTIANKLAKKHNVSVLSLREGCQYEMDKNIDIIISKTNGNKLKKVLEIRRVIKQVNPDTIISFEYFTNMETCLADIGIKNNLIISERNDPKVKGNKYKHIRNFLYRFCNKLVCQTEDAKNYFPRYIQQKTTIILNPLKEKLPLPYKGKRKNVIVNFCRLEQQKNIKMLIDAFRIVKERYPKYELYIYGEGKEEKELKEYIRKSGLIDSARIFPFNNDIHNEIKSYSIFASSSDYEGLSNSMLEAMAIGLPTICTDCPCGGARMVIENRKNGLLVKVGDFNDMASKIIELIENPKFAEQLSKNALNIREKLAINNIVQEWEKLV